MAISLNHLLAEHLSVKQQANICEHSAEKIVIQNLALDSRQVLPGTLFFAQSGTYKQGAAFIDEAIAKGAVAVIKENTGSEKHRCHWQGPIPIISMENLSRYVGPIAATFYGKPSDALNIIGVTGTNGKTTSVFLLAQLLKKLGVSSGSIGTLGFNAEECCLGQTLTTPDPITLQQQLAEMRHSGVKVVAMEVSSHGLAQDRVKGIDFGVALFTNLSRDHLDYHHSMSNYGETKMRLCHWPSLTTLVANVDDAWGRRALITAQCQNKVGFSISNNAQWCHGSGSEPKMNWAELHALQYSRTQSKGLFGSSWGRGNFLSHLIGQQNNENLLGVLAVLLALGHKVPELMAAVAQLLPAPGRLQGFNTEQGPLVVVDYAHTPDALAKLLNTARDICSGDIWCVFGCGGDRDRGKRRQMGEIAQSYADQVIVTQDNPRHEDPEQIVQDILQGCSHYQNIFIQADRKLAIEQAIAKAGEGDVVVVAGKGHERYQIIGDDFLPFNDAEVVSATLSRLTQSH